MPETIMRKNWLITGVSSGIGRSLAQGALAEGHVVVGTVRKPEQIKEFEKLSPGRAKAVMLDVTKPDGVVSGVRAAAKALGGRIDVLSNNAGWGLVGAIEETSEEEARDVKFFGQFNVTRAVLPIMRAQGSGHILATSAVGGFTGLAGLGVYSAAKAAVDVNEALAQEVRPFGIKVTVLTLGIFRTNFASSSLKQTASIMIEYAEAPAGQFRRFIGGLAGKQPNDPARGARGILKAVAAENPPLHLALGRDALGVMRKKIAGLQQEIEIWEATSASVVFAQLEEQAVSSDRQTDEAVASETGANCSSAVRGSHLRRDHTLRVVVSSQRPKGEGTASGESK
jgi:NAD(P)-dependent dehydrogenase (short-subunit alcohol dehydrogenase family)